MLDAGFFTKQIKTMDHHVYFWLKDECKSPAQKADFEKGLTSLCEIPLCTSGRWAVPANVELRPVVDQSWDYALTIQFPSVEAHNEYQVHPDHTKFIETFREWWAQVRVSDLA